MSSVIDGDKISASNLTMFGPRLAMPVAFVESSLFMDDITWSGACCCPLKFALVKFQV